MDAAPFHYTSWVIDTCAWLAAHFTVGP
jgi:hypothetical protein